MDELSNYELCLLIYLYYKQSVKAYRGSILSRQEEHYNTWTELAEFVNNYCQKSVITVTYDKIQNDNSITRRRNTVVIEVKDKSSLEEFLNDYSKCYENGKLKLYNSDRVSIEELKKQLYNYVDTTKELREYYIEEIKYIPVILWGLRNDLITFKDISFSLFKNKNQLKHIPYSELNKRKYNQNVLDFGIMIDLSKFMELDIAEYKDNNGDNVASNKNTAKKKKRKINYKSPIEKKYHLQDKQWQLWFCIYLQVKDLIKTANNSDTYVIIDSKLIEESGIYAKTTQPAKTITKFNEKIWEILEKKGEVEDLISQKGNKYRINMNVYRAFNNLLEGDEPNEWLKKDKDINEKEYNKIKYVLAYLKFTKSKSS